MERLGEQVCGLQTSVRGTAEVDLLPCAGLGRLARAVGSSWFRRPRLGPGASGPGTPPGPKPEAQARGSESGPPAAPSRPPVADPAWASGGRREGDTFLQAEKPVFALAHLFESS